MCCRSILFISVWTILITFKVIQSPFNQQIWLSSPRYNVGTAMPILVDFVFQFLRLRTYKSSITLLLFQMSWKELPPSIRKVTISP